MSTLLEEVQHFGSFHSPWFEKLVCAERNVDLVAAESASIFGFLIAREFPIPPVYDPGGATALIDDFCVAAKDRWQDVSAALLQDAKSELNLRGLLKWWWVAARQDARKNCFIEASKSIVGLHMVDGGSVNVAEFLILRRCRSRVNISNKTRC